MSLPLDAHTFDLRGGEGVAAAPQPSPSRPAGGSVNPFLGEGSLRAPGPAGWPPAQLSLDTEVQ